MQCERVNRYLERYMEEGSLSSALQTCIKEHLSACNVCAVTYAEMEPVKMLFKKSTPSPMAEDTVANIMMAARRSFSFERQDEYDVFSLRWLNQATLTGRAVFAGMLLMVISVGVFIGKDLWKTPVSSTTAEYPEYQAFSAAQDGSLEYSYLKITSTPAKGLLK